MKQEKRNQENHDIEIEGTDAIQKSEESAVEQSLELSEGGDQDESSQTSSDWQSKLGNGTKGRPLQASLFRALAVAYLIYLGGKLLLDANKQEGVTPQVGILFATIFIVSGLVLLFFIIKDIKKHKDEEKK